MEEIIVISREELKHDLRNVIISLEKERKSISFPHVFSINQVAKLLGRSHHTVTKLVMKGLLKTTSDGKITENALNDYLKR